MSLRAADLVMMRVWVSVKVAIGDLHLYFAVVINRNNI
jgi:hypothetical protein